jgi:enoyl reductase-like protein
MKIIRNFGILTLLLLLSSNLVFGQKQVSEGYVKMELTDVTTDDQQMAMQLEMMKGSITEVFFSKNKSMTSMDMMGGMIKMKMLSDQEKDNFDLTFDMMGQKMWINEKISAMGGDPKRAAVENSTKVTVDKTKSKTILGYKCYEFTVTSQELEGMSAKGYLTEDLKAVKGLLQTFPSLELAGFPLEFSLVNPAMTIKMTAKEVQTSVDESKMIVKTDGYKKLSMAEFQKQMGGMGGFGF